MSPLTNPNPCHRVSSLKDGTATAGEACPPPLASPAFHSRALELFRSGLDTRTIALRMGRKEPFVLREINQARSQELGLPDPYERPS